MITIIQPALAIDDVNISDLYNPATKLRGFTKIGELFSQNLITFVFVLVGLVFMFNIVMAGWDFMLSSGDAKKVAAASARFTNGFMGLIISVTSYVIVKIILTFLGIGDII